MRSGCHPHHKATTTSPPDVEVKVTLCDVTLPWVPLTMCLAAAPHVSCYCSTYLPPSCPLSIKPVRPDVSDEVDQSRKAMLKTHCFFNFK